jgi:CIC family chloride channel protein
MTLDELSALFGTTNRHAFPVLDSAGQLCGIVSLSDLRRGLERSEDGPATTGEIMTRDVLTIFPDETLDVALVRMGQEDLSRLPVVSRSNPKQVLGVIRRNDLVKAYNLALAATTERDS